MKNGTFSYGTTPKKVITKAINGEIFPMESVGKERKLMIGIVNQGIDAHLEAVTESKFTDNGSRLYCKIGPKDMHVLLRRLNESEYEEAMRLRSSILTCLEIEEV